MQAWHRRIFLGALVLAGQGLLLLLAVLIGVMDPVLPKEATFVPPADDGSHAASERQQAVKQQLAAFNRLQQTLADPSMNAIMETLHPEFPSDLPAIGPSLEAMGALLEGSLQPMMDSPGALPMGQGADLPAPDTVEFLGEQIQARRIILLLDVSASVKSKLERAGLPISDLREEVLRFIDQLGPDHLFGIIQFTRKWEAFRPELLPATTRVKDSAKDWMRSSFRTNGIAGSNWKSSSRNGIEGVLEAAFSMSPQIDEIFLLSDGDFQRSLPNGGGQDVPWNELRHLTRSLQGSNLGEARLRLLCFHPPAKAVPSLKEWARENGNGSLQLRGASP